MIQRFNAPRVFILQIATVYLDMGGKTVVDTVPKSAPKVGAEFGVTK
jgi:hypothetical protein